MSASTFLRDGARAAIPAALLSGLPSTFLSLLSKTDPLEASLAAGSILLPREQRPVRLLAAAAVVHGALSLAWAVLLAAALPHKNPVTEGAAAGLAIAALDLGVVGRHYPRIRALPLLPQIADHVAFGVVASLALSRQGVRMFRGAGLVPDPPLNRPGPSHQLDRSIFGGR